jgi:ABC-type methionine transport system ATPase subunit
MFVLTITKDANKLTYEIYRKPTTSDTIITNDSCHPIEHKLAAIRYFANRIHTYNLDQIQKQKEIHTVKEIIYNNKYNKSLLSKVHNGKKHKMTPDEDEQKQIQKWVKFTYIGKETRFITKLFKNTHLKVAYTTNNNLGKLLDRRKTEKLNKFEKNGVYQLKCPHIRGNMSARPVDRFI